MKVILNILTFITIIMFFYLPFIGVFTGIIADKGDTKLAMIIILIYGGILMIITIIQGKGGEKWEKIKNGRSK